MEREKIGLKEQEFNVSAGKLRGKVAMVLLLHLSDPSVFSSISDSRLLLLRTIGTHAAGCRLL